MPTFPARDFTVTAFGAVGNGRANCTGAIRKAIRACSSAGGGRVVVPPGRYLTGGLRLLRNVDLHVAAGATLLFRTAPEAYLPVALTRYGGNDLFNYAPLIYAYRQSNIAITGGGHAGWPGEQQPLVAVARAPQVRLEAGPAQHARPMSTACVRQPRPGFRSRSGSSAPGTICGPTSSSPTCATGC